MPLSLRSDAMNISQVQGSTSSAKKHFMLMLESYIT
jgi:hypothetical protein